MTQFVLASGSAIRRQVLTEACIEFQVQKPDVDEAALKEAHPDIQPRDMALLLGRAKSVAVSALNPEPVVLGADQTMELDGKLLDKLPRRDMARFRLLAMRGRPHFLHSGLVLSRGGEPIWEYQQTSTIHVRDFSDEFLDYYLEIAGDELTASVGAYAYEGLGSQLFEHVDGDYYAVLGLPLLPLLAELRKLGVLIS